MITNLNRITEKYPKFTRSQKIVADYLMSHRSSLAFVTLDQLAANIGVSTTTIIRFARSLGYSGYSDMQKDAQIEIIEKASLPERINRSEHTTDFSQLLSDTIRNDISNLTATLSGLSEDVLQQTVSAILRAEHLYVLGMRSSFALAHYCVSRLGEIRPHVRLVQAVGMLFPEDLIGCGPKDVCLAFLFPRFSKITIDLIRWMKGSGVQTILITGPNPSIVENYGDIILPCHVEGSSFKNSFTAPMSLVNYLGAAAAMTDKERAVETLKMTEDFLNQGYRLDSSKSI